MEALNDSILNCIEVATTKISSCFSSLFSQSQSSYAGLRNKARKCMQTESMRLKFIEEEEKNAHPTFSFNVKIVFLKNVFSSLFPHIHSFPIFSHSQLSTPLILSTSCKQFTLLHEIFSFSIRAMFFFSSSSSSSSF